MKCEGKNGFFLPRFLRKTGNFDKINGYYCLKYSQFLSLVVNYQIKIKDY